VRHAALPTRPDLHGGRGVLRQPVQRYVRVGVQQRAVRVQHAGDGPALRADRLFRPSVPDVSAAAGEPELHEPRRLRGPRCGSVRGSDRGQYRHVPARRRRGRPMRERQLPAAAQGSGARLRRRGRVLERRLHRRLLLLWAVLGPLHGMSGRDGRVRRGRGRRGVRRSDHLQWNVQSQPSDARRALPQHGCVQDDRRLPDAHQSR
jgi:hypothetical protein